MLRWSTCYIPSHVCFIKQKSIRFACQPTQVQSWSTMAHTPPLSTQPAVQSLTHYKIRHFKLTPWLIAPRKLRSTRALYQQETTGCCTKTSHKHVTTWPTGVSTMHSSFPMIPSPQDGTCWWNLRLFWTNLLQHMADQCPMHSYRIIQASEVCKPQTTHPKSSSVESRTTKRSRHWGAILTLPHNF